MCSHLGFIESVDKHFVIKNISFRVKQKFKDSVLDGLKLVFVGVYSYNKLISLIFQIWSFQTNNITAKEICGNQLRVTLIRSISLYVKIKHSAREIPAITSQNT